MSFLFVPPPSPLFFNRSVPKTLWFRYIQVHLYITFYVCNPTQKPAKVTKNHEEDFEDREPFYLEFQGPVFLGFLGLAFFLWGGGAGGEEWVWGLAFSFGGGERVGLGLAFFFKGESGFGVSFFF